MRLQYGWMCRKMTCCIMVGCVYNMFGSIYIIVRWRATTHGWMCRKMTCCIMVGCVYNMAGFNYIKVGWRATTQPYINGIFGREITTYTVIYGVYIRFWPTLYVHHIIKPYIIRNFLAGKSPNTQSYTVYMYMVVSNPTQEPCHAFKRHSI